MFVENIHAPQREIKQFAELSLEDFGLETFAEKYREQDYFQALSEAAQKMILSDSPYTDLLQRYGCEFDQKMGGMSLVHPFLEIGGAIRIQVPLPQNFDELSILLQVVLQRYEGETLSAFLSGGFNAFSPLDSLKIDLGQNASLCVWNDACRMHEVHNPLEDGFNTQDFNQSLLMVLCSVIYQQADLDAYGKRGRYGAETVRRLIDGHASHPTELSPANKTITAFIFDTRDGKPFGFYNGVVFPQKFNFQLENGAWKFCDVGAPSLHLNYTFIQKAPNGVIDPGRTPSAVNHDAPRFTDQMVAGLLSRAAILIGCREEDFYITIHTDKCAAAKSAEKYLDCRGENKNHYRAICRKVWTNIIHNRLLKFRAGIETNDWNSLYFVDRSTVEKGDPAEEVALGSDRFYKVIYPAYAKLVFDRTGKNISPNLQNSYIDWDSLEAFCRTNEINFEATKIALQSENMTYRGSSTSFLDGDRISNYWQMNSRHSWRTLNIDWNALKIFGDRAKIMFGKFLNVMAKAENSSNSAISASFTENVDRDVPRLTEFGFILAGNLKMLSDTGDKTRIGKAVNAMQEKMRRSRL